MTALAHADQFRDEYVVWSSSRMAGGIWVMNGSFRRLPSTAGAGELGEAVVWALDESAREVAPQSLRGGPLPFQPILDDLGLRSYARYAADTRATMIEQEGVLVTVTPLRHAGARAGFTPILDALVRLEQPTATTLGAAVVASLARATPPSAG